MSKLQVMSSMLLVGKRRIEITTVTEARTARRIATTNNKTVLKVARGQYWVLSNEDYQFIFNRCSV